nr:MAG TPA: hypothetical protein [Caudoviricetes sp.]
MAGLPFSRNRENGIIAVGIVPGFFVALLARNNREIPPPYRAFGMTWVGATVVGNEIPRRTYILHSE